MELTQEGALEEIVADSMFKVFENERYVQELFNQHETLGEKIKGKLKNFVKELKQLAKNLKSPEARAMANKKAATINKMAELFNNAATMAMAKRYNETVMRAAQAQQGQEGAQYQLKDSDGNIVEMTEQQLEDNKKTVANMDTVAVVKGNDFKQDYLTKALKYFEKNGNVAHNAIIGDVAIEEDGLRHLVHFISQRKTALIPIIKDVIEKGEIVHVEDNHKGKGYPTAIIAAKVTLDEKNYYVGVSVRQIRRGIRGTTFMTLF